MEEQQVEMDALNELSMQILVHAGDARNYMVKGLVALEKKNFTESEELINQAHEEIIIAHGLQTSTLQKEAEGEPIRYSTLFCHAQDTLMTAQSEVLIAKRLISLFNTFSQKEGGEQ